MKKKTKSFIIGFACAFLVFFIFPLFLMYDPMKNLPEGELVESLVSPNGEYTMNSYFIYGGPISADDVRVEIVNNETLKKRNIYYYHNKKNVSMKWLDNEIVEIDEIELNIHKDHYNRRSGD